jgi:hypothetical protein
MIELQLTPEQIKQLRPIVTEEPKNPILFVATAAPRWNGADTVWRFQVEQLDWRHANKILKIINEEPKKKNDTHS